MPDANKDSAEVRRDDDIIAWLYKDAGNAFKVLSDRAERLAGLVRAIGRTACLADGEEFDRLAFWTCELRKLVSEAHRAA